MPVVNLLSDLAHPMQALADLLTLRQELGALHGRHVVWTGDFTNVARSLAKASGKLGMTMVAACPAGYGPRPGDLAAMPWLAGFQALAAPYTGLVKIRAIKAMDLDNVSDGCLIKIETDAGMTGYGEAGIPAAAARARRVAGYTGGGTPADATGGGVPARGSVDRGVGDPTPSAPLKQVWFRAVDRVPSDDLWMHRCLLAYVSDYNLFDVALRPHGIPIIRLQLASIDHAMWFHRPFRADDWLLYDQRPLSTGSGRGLAGGSIYTRDGLLAVSVVQEGLVRIAGS